jgi:hypothetical protein
MGGYTRLMITKSLMEECAQWTPGYLKSSMRPVPCFQIMSSILKKNYYFHMQYTWKIVCEIPGSHFGGSDTAPTILKGIFC